MSIRTIEMFLSRRLSVRNAFAGRNVAIGVGSGRTEIASAPRLGDRFAALARRQARRAAEKDAAD
jgi:hypothetical protein